MKILIAGDSTAADYQEHDAPMMGWGQCLKKFVDKNVVVSNFAVPGRSTRSFRNEGHWDNLLDKVMPEDIVLIQFGHNDQKLDDPQYTDEKIYKANLRRFVLEVLQKKAKPILLTSVSRCLFSPDGKLIPSLGHYPEYMREIAKQTKTELIDLNHLTKKMLQSLGQKRAISLFAFPSPGGWGFSKGEQDTSHFNQKGASCIVSLIFTEAKKKNLELVQYLNNDIKEITLC